MKSFVAAQTAGTPVGRPETSPVCWWTSGCLLEQVSPARGWNRTGRGWGGENREEVREEWGRGGTGGQIGPRRGVRLAVAAVGAKSQALPGRDPPAWGKADDCQPLTQIAHTSELGLTPRQGGTRAPSMEVATQCRQAVSSLLAGITSILGEAGRCSWVGEGWSEVWTSDNHHCQTLTPMVGCTVQH